MKDTEHLIILDEKTKKMSTREFFFKVFCFLCFCFLTAAGLFSFFAYATARIIYERIDNVSSVYVLITLLFVFGVWLISKRK